MPELYHSSESQEHSLRLCHEAFLQVVQQNPELEFCAITENALYVYNKEEDYFVRSDGSDKQKASSQAIYTYVSAANTFQLCLLSFENMDQVLDYIAEGTYKNDFKTYIERVTMSIIQQRIIEQLKEDKDETRD